jgi:hypothetical protein
MTDLILCNDCKHAFRPLGDWWIPKNIALRCRLAFVPETIKEDLVTGPKKEEAHYQRCTMARHEWASDKSNCGKEGRFWAPKDKKDLFKHIKHIGK